MLGISFVNSVSRYKIFLRLQTNQTNKHTNYYWISPVASQNDEFEPDTSGLRQSSFFACISNIPSDVCDWSIPSLTCSAVGVGLRHCPRMARSWTHSSSYGQCSTGHWSFWPCGRTWEVVRGRIALEPPQRSLCEPLSVHLCWAVSSWAVSGWQWFTWSIVEIFLQHMRFFYTK